MRALAVVVAVAVCSLGAGCGGGGDDPGGGSGGAPQAGDKPVGAGHKGQHGKKARGGPIDVPEIYLVGQGRREVADHLTGHIKPQCPGKRLCVHYVFTDLDEGPCYAGGPVSYPRPLLPGGTITIQMGGVCSTPGSGETDITDEPSASGSASGPASPPPQPPVTPEPTEQPEPSSAPS